LCGSGVLKIPAMDTALRLPGIAVFTLLPAMRVTLIAVLFLRERDHTYAAIAGMVLAIILASAVAAL
jgi:uncharacterized membrane protein